MWLYSFWWSVNSFKMCILIFYLLFDSLMMVTIPLTNSLVKRIMSILFWLISIVKNVDEQSSIIKILDERSFMSSRYNARGWDYSRVSCDIKRNRIVEDFENWKNLPTMRSTSKWCKISYTSSSNEDQLTSKIILVDCKTSRSIFSHCMSTHLYSLATSLSCEIFKFCFSQ